jgi:hypothetical protein
VAQRRRRVFGLFSRLDSGAERCAEILSLRESLRGHPAPRRETGQGVAGCLTGGASGGSSHGKKSGTDREGVLTSAKAVRTPTGGIDREDMHTLVTCPLTGNPYGDHESRESLLIPAVAQPIRSNVYNNSDPGMEARGLIPCVAGCLSAGAHPGSYNGQDAHNDMLVPVAFKPSHYTRGKDGAPSDVYPPLSADADKGDQDGILLTRDDKSCSVQGINKKGVGHACTQKGNAAEALRALRGQVGEKAFAQWGLGILDSLQSPEVLQSALHGVGIRRAARQAGVRMDDGALPRPEDLPDRSMRALWESGPDGRSPFGQQLAQQLAAELGTAVPFVPHQSAPMSVRRLTPTEAERLQGFPDGHTAGFSDSTRYKMLGNAVCVNVAEWIARRLAKECQKGGG